MKIEFLGTGACEAWPSFYCECEFCNHSRKLGGRHLRTRSQTLINDDLLIDFGPDLVLHELHGNLDTRKIKDLLITHTHDDHFLLQNIQYRQWNGFTHYNNKVLNIYGNDALYKIGIESQESPRAELKEFNVFHEMIEHEEYPVGNYHVTPILASHDESEKCFIYVIRQENKTILYANDTGILRDSEFDFLKKFKFDLISLDCTTMINPCDDYHMGIDACIKFRDKLSEQGSIDANTVCIVNHFSHNGGCNSDEFEKIAEDKGFIMAYDGYNIEI